MTTHAYNEHYLTDASCNLGEAFDYAVNACHIDIELFMRLFIATGYADRFGNGNPRLVAGLSGTELAACILSSAGEPGEFPAALSEYDYSPEYWCGYILACYQWESGKSFREIHRALSMYEILKLYPTLHEASEERCIDSLDAIISRRMGPTRLQTQRKLMGFTQKELSIRSGVNLRTLQQYETRAKDLGSAAASTVLILARTLGCSISDLVG